MFLLQAREGLYNSGGEAFCYLRKLLRCVSAAGKTISTKKEELVSILDHCNVQVDNPVSILNQDTSRHFLQKSKPSDKYKLFMKGTHLEQIATDYEKAEQDQKIMKDAISRQKSVSEIMFSSGWDVWLVGASSNPQTPKLWLWTARKGWPESSKSLLQQFALYRLDYTKRLLHYYH